jgi:type IV pilus assembly protein PilN
MLVEINLLPKKEHRKSSLFVIAILIFLLLASAFIAIYIQGSSYESKMEAVDKQIDSLQKLNTAHQDKLSGDEAGNSAIKLQSALQWAEQYPMETVVLMQNIIALLPERGFIQSFEYSNMNTVLITIQYDASRDAAYYLSSLKQSEWVQEADLLNIVAVKMEEEAEEGETNGSGTSDKKILPRYSAAYNIIFKPEFFKGSKNASEGGDES